MGKTSENMRRVREALTGRHRVLVATHARPDGDANGSQAALCRLLAPRVKRVSAVIEQPDGLGPTGFLLDALAPLSIGAALRETWDVVVLLDCAVPERAPGGLVPLLRSHPRVVAVDHHVTHAFAGALAWVETGASSTGEMIARLAGAAGWDLDRDAAEALWIAMVTDTGRFTYDNTRAQTLRVAARLLAAAPVRTEWLYDRVYGVPLHGLRLRARAMASLDVWHGGRMAAVRLGPADFRATGCAATELEFVIDIPRSLASASASVLLSQVEVGAPTRMSLRTRPPLDAARFCAGLGGGGHVRAAGCTLDMPLAAAWTRIREATAAWVRDPEPTDASPFSPRPGTRRSRRPRPAV